MEVGTSHACLRDHEETDWLIWNSQEWGRAKFKQGVRQVTPRPRQPSKVFESEVKGISGVEGKPVRTPVPGGLGGCGKGEGERVWCRCSEKERV